MLRDLRDAARVLLKQSGFVLLIACGNIAALLLVRGLQRQQECEVRLALGVGGPSSSAQATSESVSAGGVRRRVVTIAQTALTLARLVSAGPSSGR